MYMLIPQRDQTLFREQVSDGFDISESFNTLISLYPFLENVHYIYD